MLDWTFDDRFVSELPGEPPPDPEADPEAARIPRRVQHAVYSRVDPEPVSRPERIGWVPEVARAVGLDPDVDPDVVAPVLVGNRRSPTMKPYAARYGGHQFGAWAGQLGDGRAITLGEAVGPDGTRLEVQLKGAGRTPYSRRGDGRAVLRSSIREFLCAEAVHHLGIPTTRSLSLCTTGDEIVRDMFYDGRPAPEPGAIVARVAPSFLRFGSYQILAAWGERDTLERLVRYTLRHHFPDVGEVPATGPIPDETLIAWAATVGRRSRELVVHWQRVGFVHGVLNTDNMSVLGSTIDYGPYGWLDVFDLDFTPNTSDLPARRYRFGQQPIAVMWNLARFLEAVSPLLDDPEPLQGVLDEFRDALAPEWLAMMRGKLGLQTSTDDDDRLVDGLIELLGAVQTDMTLFFRGLADVPIADVPIADVSVEAARTDRLEPLRGAFYQDLDAEAEGRFGAWLDDYAARVRAEGADAERKARMDRVNPAFILRNHLVQAAIVRATEGDMSEIERLLALSREPYRISAEARPEDLGRQPAWARDEPGCGMLSCSS